MRNLMKTAGLLSVLLQTAAAATLIPPPLTVLGTDVFSGPAFIVPVNYSATDTLSFTVSGIVYEQPGNTMGSNAAGVIVVAGSHPVGSSLANLFDTFGSLLLGNGITLPFKQLFPTTAANGLGSSSPPTTLVFNQTIGSVFGSGLSAGTILQFRVSDVNTFDNSGSFTISGPSDDTVPEPGALLLTGTGFGLLGLAQLRRRTR